MSYIERAKIGNVKFSNFSKEQWTLDMYKIYADEAIIPVVYIWFKFVEPFNVQGSIKSFSGKVMIIWDD